MYLVELIRVALWTLWLNRNILYFNNIATSVRKIDAQTISLASFLCKAKSNNSFFKLILILPGDVSNLPMQSSIGPLVQGEDLVQ